MLSIFWKPNKESGKIKMETQFANQETIINQEIYRAKEIIKIAERDGKDPALALRDYGVAKSIINEIGLDIVGYTPKQKKVTTNSKLENWVKLHVGETIDGGKKISKDTGLSYATTNKFVQTRRDIFSKIKKGTYVVKDVGSDRLFS